MVPATAFSRPPIAALLFFLFALPWVRWEFGWKTFLHPETLRDYFAVTFTLVLSILVVLGRRGNALPPSDIAEEKDESSSLFLLEATETHGLPASRAPHRKPCIAFLGPAFLLFFCLWNTLSLLWSSEIESTRLALQRIIPWCLLVLLLTWIARGERIRRRLILWIFGSSFFTALGALFTGSCYPEMRYTTERWMWPFGNPSVLGGFLLFSAIALPLLAIRVGARNRRAALLAICAFLPTGAALWMSGARSSLLGLAAGWSIGLIVLSPPPRRRRMALGMVGVSLLLAAGFGAWLFTEDGHRFLYTNSAGVRILLAETAWRMAMARPFTGGGAGTFYRDAYRFEDAQAYLHSGRGDMCLETHSEPMQILAELGWAGFLAWLAIHVVAICRLARAAPRSTISLVLVAGLGGMVVDSWASPAFRFDGNGVSWIYAIVLGLALSGSCSPVMSMRDASTGWTLFLCGLCGREFLGRGISRRIRIIFPVAALGLSLFVLAGVIVPAIRADFAFARARAILYSDPNGAAHAIKTTIAGVWSPYLRYPVLEMLGYALQKSGRINEALDLHRTMLSIFPSNPVNRKELIRLGLRFKWYQEVLRLAVEGLAINQYDVYAEEGIESAIQGIVSLNRSIRAVPAQREECDAYPDDEDLEKSSMNRATERHAERKDAGTTVDCHALFRDLPKLSPADRTGLEARILWASGRREEAVEMLRRAPFHAIRVGHGALLLGQWLAELGRTEEARAVILPAARRIPADPRAMVLAAVLLSESDRLEDGDEMLAMVERAVTQAPTLPSAVRLAVYTWILLGNRQGDRALLDRARQVARTAVAIKPSHAELHGILIETLERLGASEEAWKARREAQRLFPRNPRFGETSPPPP